MKTPEQLKGTIRSIAAKRNLRAQEVLQMFLFGQFELPKELYSQGWPAYFFNDWYQRAYYDGYGYYGSRHPNGRR